MRVYDEEMKEGLSYEWFLLMVLEGVPLSTVETPPRVWLFKTDAMCDHFNLVGQEMKLFLEISRVSLFLPVEKKLQQNLWLLGCYDSRLLFTLWR